MGRHPDRLKKRGNLWWTWFYVPELQADGTVIKRKREVSTGQRDRSLAREAARRLEREAVIVAELPEALHLEEVIARYMVILDSGQKRPDTISFYEKKSKPLLRIFGNARDVRQMTMVDSDDYAAARRLEGVGRATVAKELGLLRAALRAARKRGLYDGDTSWCIPEYLRDVYVPRETVLTHEQYQALRAALPEARRDHLAAYCGLGVRDGELLRLTAEDVVGERVRIRGHKGQREARDRWLTPQADILEVLRRRAEAHPEGPMFDDWHNRRRDLHLACDTAKVPRVSPNDLRRTFCTWLAEAGVPELVVSRLMGHTSSAMVRKVYSRVGDTATANALRHLPALRTVPLIVSDGAGLGGRGGRSGRRGPRNRRVLMPGGGIEPPTRGFSSLLDSLQSPWFSMHSAPDCLVDCL